MRLLVGSSPKSIIAYVGEANYCSHFGALHQPRSGSKAPVSLGYGVPWALDNDAYKNFDTTRFMRMLRRYQDVPGCTFVAAPDVVGDAHATLDSFAYWQPIIKGMGYPVALVGQDGLECLPIPWEMFGTFFIGGSTDWKLVSAAASVVSEAKRRGKWVHMGRVNSGIRIRYAQRIGCDSADGTGYAAFLHYCKDALPYLQTRQLSLLEVT